MDENHEKSKSSWSRWIIAGVVIGVDLIAAIASPSFIRARTTPTSNACVNNLRQID
jgi:hypothetical protein